jgi:hypothetical protein
LRTKNSHNNNNNQISKKSQLQCILQRSAYSICNL